MIEPDEDLKKFEEELKKPRTGVVKKDRIVSCPSCGIKRTMMQVSIGQEVKCKGCGANFVIKKDLAQDAHLVTMAAVDLQVKQMEMMQRVGKVAPPAKKKISVTTPQVVKPKSGGHGPLRIILYLVILLVIALAVILALHFAKVIDIQPYLDKIKSALGL